MYRNEQLLAPEGDSATEASLSGTDPHEEESESSRADKQGEEDTAPAPVEGPSATDGNSHDSVATPESDQFGSEDDGRQGASEDQPVSASTSSTNESHDQAADGDTVTDDAVIRSDLTTDAARQQ